MIQCPTSLRTSGSPETEAALPSTGRRYVPGTFSPVGPVPACACSWKRGIWWWAWVGVSREGCLVDRLPQWTPHSSVVLSDDDFRCSVSLTVALLFLILKDVTYGVTSQAIKKLALCLLRGSQISADFTNMTYCDSQNNSYSGFPVAKALGTFHMNQGMMSFFVCLSGWLVFGSIKAALSQWKAPDCDGRMTLWAKLCWEISVWRITSFYWLWTAGLSASSTYFLGMLTKNEWMMQVHRATVPPKSWGKCHLGEVGRNVKRSQFHESYLETFWPGKRQASAIHLSSARTL